jgi:septal ring factor EnvC (AmiA/AmiB activator)
MAPPDDHAQAVTDELALDHTRIRAVVAVLFTLVALVATAQADVKKRVIVVPREALGQQLAGEAESIDRALATVTSKLADIDALHTRRAVAAYRLVRDARTTNDPLTTSRRRAAAQLLLERDLGERNLLAGEASRLRAARARVATEQTQLASVELPAQVGRPARGAIARRFGTLVHEKSKATLARRGLDFDVEARADAVASADGVVRFAGPIRGLDSGVIIDHGTYLTVLGKLGELAVPVGARVQRGDRVGRAARQRVYFEVRVKLGPGGLPIDPEPLLAPANENAPLRKR